MAFNDGIYITGKEGSYYILTNAIDVSENLFKLYDKRWTR